MKSPLRLQFGPNASTSASLSRWPKCQLDIFSLCSTAFCQDIPTKLHLDRLGPKPTHVECYLLYRRSEQPSFTHLASSRGPGIRFALVINMVPLAPFGVSKRH